MILAEAAPYVSAQIAASWGPTRKDALSLLLYAPVDQFLWSRVSTHTLGEFLGVNRRRAREVMAELVDARSVERDPGTGRRPDGYRLLGALREWRVPWRIAPQFVESRLIDGGWLVSAPNPLAGGPGPATNGVVERGPKPAHKKLLGAGLGLPTTKTLGGRPGPALYGGPLSLGASLDPIGSNSNSLSEREGGWSTTEAGELAAAITARGNGSPDPRSSLGPRVEALARSIGVDEARRRLASAPANYGPPMLVRWIEQPSSGSSGSSAPRPAEPGPRPNVYEPPPEVEAVLPRAELLDRIKARKTNGDHAIMEV